MSDKNKLISNVATILLTLIIFSALVAITGCFNSNAKPSTVDNTSNSTHKATNITTLQNISVKSSTTQNNSTNNISSNVTNPSNSSGLIGIIKNSGKGKSDLPPPPKPN